MTNWKHYLCNETEKCNGEDCCCYLGDTKVNKVSGQCEGCLYNTSRYMIPGSNWWKNKTGNIFIDKDGKIWDQLEFEENLDKQIS